MKQPRFERMHQIVIALALCLTAAPALAGIADWPLPVLVAGKKTIHVYSVSGVNGGAGGLLGTFFSCTSTDTATMQVGVEVFAPGGCAPNVCAPVNDAIATSLSVQPGATVLFGTQSSATFGIDSNLGVLAANNSARILATSTKLICTAFLADITSAPPTSMVQLTIVKRKTQKGD